MDRTLIPPFGSKQPAHPPMVYIERQWKWEYKQIARNLEKESPLNETELNALGEEGWEVSGVVQQPPVAYFYFKRLIEK
jgi:hypothetical protein